MGLTPKDPDIREDPPITVVYNLGRDLAWLNPTAGRCALAFRARPDAWMDDEDLRAWAELPEEEAWLWLRRGWDAGPPSRRNIVTGVVEQMVTNGR